MILKKQTSGKGVFEETAEICRYTQARVPNMFNFLRVSHGKREQSTPPQKNKPSGGSPWEGGREGKNADNQFAVRRFTRKL